MVNIADMRVTNIWNYQGDEVGGFNNLGITLKDNHNYLYAWIFEVKWSRGCLSFSYNHLQNRHTQNVMFY